MLLEIRAGKEDSCQLSDFIHWTHQRSLLPPLCISAPILLHEICFLYMAFNFSHIVLKEPIYTYLFIYIKSEMLKKCGNCLLTSSQILLRVNHQKLGQIGFFWMIITKRLFVFSNQFAIPNQSMYHNFIQCVNFMHFRL